MSDYGQPDQPPRRRYSADEPQPSPYDELGPDPDDPMAVLEQRLQSMTPDAATSAQAPERETRAASPPPPPPSMPRGRTRPAGRRRRSGSVVARIAAPVVFLIAVIAVVALVYESGIVGGQDESPVATPTPKASKTTKSGTTIKVTTFKKYTVKDGDTLSAIAAKYGTTVNAILALNPDMSTSTLVVGTRIKVPKPSPSP